MLRDQADITLDNTIVENADWQEQDKDTIYRFRMHFLLVTLLPTLLVTLLPTLLVTLLPTDLMVIICRKGKRLFCVIAGKLIVVGKYCLIWEYLINQRTSNSM